MNTIIAFLNGDINSNVYGELPPGYVYNGVKYLKEWVYRLLKLIYGLKQSPRLWYKTL
jgi:hypothetical protein